MEEDGSEWKCRLRLEVVGLFQGETASTHSADAACSSLVGLELFIKQDRLHCWRLFTQPLTDCDSAHPLTHALCNPLCSPP
jgi:hypothetical protein